MSTDAESREQYRTRFQAAQAEVADFQATGMLNADAELLLTKLPPITEIEDDKVRACVTIGDNYNRALVAIAHALGSHAKTRDEVSAFCGLWSRIGSHAPYNSNIRKLLYGAIWKRIASDNDDVRLTDLVRTMRWLYWRAKELAIG
jgi:hypothetical protein